MKPTFDAIFTVRATGTRLYGKPLQLIDIEQRMTILEYLVKYLEKSQRIGRTILAIADSKGNDIFADLAEKHGWDYMFGDEIDVLGRIVKAANQFGTDVIFHGSSESPFLHYHDIDRLYDRHVEGGFDLTKLSSLPEGASYSITSTSAFRTCHDKGTSRHRSELINSYIFDNQHEFRIHVEPPASMYCRPEVRITVDYPEDLTFCRRVYRALQGGTSMVEIADVIAFWDANPEVRRPMEEMGIDWGHGRLWQ